MRAHLAANSHPETSAAPAIPATPTARRAERISVKYYCKKLAERDGPSTAVTNAFAAALATSSGFLNLKQIFVVEESKLVERLTTRSSTRKCHKACNRLKIPSIKLGSFSLGIEILWFANGCENGGLKWLGVGIHNNVDPRYSANSNNPSSSRR
ncbi:hypothetical protein PIB30_087360 [Stylosanthes scabra]|uniref:Uncharacterized protein n=1 Tax=Stylosanthes scabra TaxID=79078 RepID=A0ABU6TVR2_9FABA|nr:hypothetical protein [Stylosanthes scabra]